MSESDGSVCELRPCLESQAARVASGTMAYAGPMIVRERSFWRGVGWLLMAAGQVLFFVSVAALAPPTQRGWSAGCRGIHRMFCAIDAKCCEADEQVTVFGVVCLLGFTLGALLAVVVMLTMVWC